MTGSALPASAHDVLEFWFADALAGPQQAAVRSKVWFTFDPRFDAAIAQRFGRLLEPAASGALDAWRTTPAAALARIIVLDQFPRNLYRDSARAFAYDGTALRAAVEAVDMNFHVRLEPLQAVFMLLPFEHSEHLAIQTRSVHLFEQLRLREPVGCEALFDGYLDYARRHRDVIERFARFPHRNAVLGRAPTAAEAAYLGAGGEHFGPRSA